MSKFYLAFLIVFSSFSSSYAIDISVREGIVKFKHGRFNALQVKIIGVQEKDVLKAWSKKMKKLKGKVKSARHGSEALGAVLFEVHHYPVNLYAQSKQNDTYVEFSVAVDLEGKYVESSENMKACSAMEKFLIDFSKDVIKAQVQSELDAAQKSLKQEQKKMEKLKKKTVRLNANIVGWKTDLKIAESEVIQNSIDQKNQVDIIIKQQEKIEIIKNKQLEI